MRQPCVIGVAKFVVWIGNAVPTLVGKGKDISDWSEMVGSVVCDVSWEVREVGRLPGRSRWGIGNITKEEAMSQWT